MLSSADQKCVAKSSKLNLSCINKFIIFLMFYILKIEAKLMWLTSLLIIAHSHQRSVAFTAGYWQPSYVLYSQVFLYCVCNPFKYSFIWSIYCKWRQERRLVYYMRFYYGKLTICFSQKLLKYIGKMLWIVPIWIAFQRKLKKCADNNI